MRVSKITIEDMEFIYRSLSEKEKERLKNRTILVTGYAGSLGYTLMHFFAINGHRLGIKKVYGIDNCLLGKPEWIDEISENPLFELHEKDIINCDLSFAESADLVFHMASLASPVFYRQYPIETMDADVTGLRRLLDFYKDKKIKGFLFYSSSEIYGDPDPSNIPTSEQYWGNVNPCGPRACYDESKRFGETLCYNFSRVYNLPLTIVRPFNNYGPGMSMNDQRVVADFAKSVVLNKDIVIYSDGKPTRTFDYIADATVGYIKCALHGKFEVFNIGSDNAELTVLELAELYQKIGSEFGYKGNIVFENHHDAEYLADNPQRRCPDITKAKVMLEYSPKIHIEDGVRRYLAFLNEKMIVK